MGHPVSLDISLLSQKLQTSLKKALLHAFIELVTHPLCLFIFAAILHTAECT
jgi:hypothetical protein